jgi:hypothetical protein
MCPLGRYPAMAMMISFGRNGEGGSECCILGEGIAWYAKFWEKLRMLVTELESG